MIRVLEPSKVPHHIDCVGTHPFVVDCVEQGLLRLHNRDVSDWCWDTFGACRDRWVSFQQGWFVSHVCFQREADAMLFILRWAGSAPDR